MSQEKLLPILPWSIPKFRENRSTEQKNLLVVQFMRQSLNNIRVNSALISMELNCCGIFKIQGF